MGKLVDGEWRECHIQERGHLEAHGVGIEFLTYRILHPGVGYENPPGRNGGTKSREPGGGKVEAPAHLIPAEEHHGHEGALHEECQDAFDGEGSAEYVAHEPGVIAPVGAEFKLQDDACGNAHGEVDAKEFLPETGYVLPERLVGAVVACFGDAHDYCQSQGERDEQPMVDGRECELRPRPVDGG